MKAIIKKIVHKKGEFTNGTNGTSIHYDTFNVGAEVVSEIRVTTPIIEAAGHEYLDLKLRKDDYLAFFNNHPLTDLIGHLFDFQFDQAGKLIDIEFIK